MQNLKRDIISAIVISALTMALALAWGSPFIGTSPAHAQDKVQPQLHQPQQQSEKQTVTVEAKAKPHPGVLDRSSKR
jgi:hypothetical protein